MLLAQALGPHVGSRRENQGSEWLTPFLAPRAWPEGAELRVPASMTPSALLMTYMQADREKPWLGGISTSWPEAPLPRPSPPSVPSASVWQGSPSQTGPLLQSNDSTAILRHALSEPSQQLTRQGPCHHHEPVPRAHRHAPNSRHDVIILTAPTSDSGPKTSHALPLEPSQQPVPTDYCYPTG